jgi:UDP-N-acetylglucosamine 1-carboxyvinyltransferase
MLHILSHLGAAVNITGDTVTIDMEELTTNIIPDETAKKIRGSIFIMGAVLSRTGFVKLPYPGGCAIGSRPIDIHIRALQNIGAKITEKDGHIECEIKKQKGKRQRIIYLDFPSVGATENVILAAALGRGIVRIVNAAMEPEIVDLCDFINACGGKITGAGTNTITIDGARELRGVEYTPIPDRISTGSYMIAAAACGGDITLKNVVPHHNGNLLEKLKTLGCEITATENSLRIICNKTKKIKAKNFNIHTAPYPGFPTDLQSQFAVLSALTKGHTTITENLFENRFRYAEELRKLGADITVDTKFARIRGTERFHAIFTPHICPAAYEKDAPADCDGVTLSAADLRGGVALVIAALAASGTSTVTNAEYIYRGHEDIVRDLRGVGANIIRIDN